MVSSASNTVDGNTSRPNRVNVGEDDGPQTPRTVVNLNLPVRILRNEDPTNNLQELDPENIYFR